jgi:hypothetical protein
MRITLDIDLETGNLRLEEDNDEPAQDWSDDDERILLRQDQKRALFAAFTQAFGCSDSEARHLFTRMVLGFHPDALVSWACGSAFAITAAEASRLLDVLDVIERTQIAVEAA